MRNHIREIIWGVTALLGAGLTGLFLISHRRMGETSYYSEKIDHIIYKLDIGFHWTTLIGMIGVILFILGVQSLLKAEKYVLGTAALTVSVIHLCAWDFFSYASTRYAELVYKNYNVSNWKFMYDSVKSLSMILTIGLLAVMLWKMKEAKNPVSYYILSILTFLSALSCMLYITICNQWFLFQTITAVAAIIVVCGGRRIYPLIKKKRKRAGWKVITGSKS